LQSFPILIAISAYERRQYHLKQRSIQLRPSPLDHVIDHIQRPSLFE